MWKRSSKVVCLNKIRSDMIMPQCKLISLGSNANERVIPQYRAIFEMTKLRYKLSQVSVSWSNLLKNMLITIRGLCSSVSISISNINERSTTNHTSSDQNESPLLKVIVVIWREYLISSKERACLDVNWCLWDQPPMKGLCPSIGQINQSYPVLQCEMNLNTSEEQLYLKNHHRPKGVCPCVKYTRWNAPIMSHALMWKRTSDILQGMDMAQKSVID